MNSRTASIVGVAAIVIVVSVLLATRSSGSSTPNPEPSGSPTVMSIFQKLSPTDAQSLLADKSSDSSFVLLDVRTPEEFSTSHITGAQNLVDYYAADSQEKIAALDHAKTYLVYCRTGHRSGEIATSMHSLGFSKVYDLNGGITAWQAAGLPVE